MYNPDIHKRKSIRLKDYDYSREGLYFITIAINKKLCLFGDIKDGEMDLFDSGKMVENEWLNLKNRFENIRLLDFVVMPNHLHGIIKITDANVGRDEGTHKGYPYNGLNVGAIPCGCPKKTSCGCPHVDKENQDLIIQDFNFNNKKDFDDNLCRETIGNIVGAFKSITTNEYIKNVNSKKWKPFYQKLWQRNYFEEIIKNQEMLIKIKEYIKNNIQNWNEDDLHVSDIY